MDVHTLMGPLMGAAPNFEAGGLGTYLWAFGQGVLVDFTPCVYPLIPITVAIFGAQGVSKLKALGLAASYVMGMAVLYTSLGVAVALTGGAFGTWLANPLVVIPLALLLVALSASMFGAYDIQLPPKLQTKLNSVGGAGPVSAFLMGLVSGLISAPCTGPVLLGLLTYIAKASAAGEPVVHGASLLFVYALGMGTLFFAVALGASLFQPGKWMEYVKSFFGVALLVMAFWFLRPLHPAIETFTLHPEFGLWIGIAITIAGIALGAIHLSFHGETKEKVRKAIAVALAVFGASVALNNQLYVELEAEWQKVETMDELAQHLEDASAEGRPVLVDFGASWCNPCKELERNTLSKPEVEDELARYELIKVDVTDPNEEQAAMQSALYGQALPSIVVWDSSVDLSGSIGAIRAGEPAPEPTVHINEPVEPDAFLEALSVVEGQG